MISRLIINLFTKIGKRIPIATPIATPGAVGIKAGIKATPAKVITTTVLTTLSSLSLPNIMQLVEIVNIFFTLLLTMVRFSAKLAYFMVILGFIAFIVWIHKENLNINFIWLIDGIQKIFPSLIISETLRHALSIFGLIIISLIFLLFFIKMLFVTPSQTDTILADIQENSGKPKILKTSLILTEAPSQTTIFGKIWGLLVSSFLFSLFSALTFFLFISLPAIFNKYNGFKTTAFEILPQSNPLDKQLWFDELLLFLKSKQIRADVIENIISTPRNNIIQKGARVQPKNNTSPSANIKRNDNVVQRNPINNKKLHTTPTDNDKK